MRAAIVARVIAEAAGLLLLLWLAANDLPWSALRALVERVR